MDAPAGKPMLEQARQAYRQNRYAVASNYFTLYLTENPEDGPAWAEYLDAQRRLPGVKREVVDVSRRLLNMLSPKGTVKQRVQAFLERLRLAPYDLDVLSRLCELAEESRWPQTVVVAALDVAKHTQDAAARRDAKIRLAKAYYALAQYQKSCDILKEFERDPARPQDVAQLMKDASAMLATSKMADKKSSHEAATPESATLIAKTPQQKREEEIQTLTTRISEAQTDPAKAAVAALQLAGIHAAAHEFEKAIQVLKKGRERNPNNTDLEVRLTELQLAQLDGEIARVRADPGANEEQVRELERKRWVIVVDSYSALAQKMPNDGEIHLRLGEGLLNIWRHTREEEILRRAVTHLQFDFTKYEQSLPAKTLLAQCLMELGLPEGAELMVTKFIGTLDMRDKAMRSAYLEACYILGEIRERRGDLPGALTAYMELASQDIEFGDTLGRIRALQAKLKN